MSWASATLWRNWNSSGTETDKIKAAIRETIEEAARRCTATARTWRRHDERLMGEGADAAALAVLAMLEEAPDGR